MVGLGAEVAGPALAFPIDDEGACVHVAVVDFCHAGFDAEEEVGGVESGAVDGDGAFAGSDEVVGEFVGCGIDFFREPEGGEDVEAACFFRVDFLEGRGDEVQEIGVFCFASHPCGGGHGGDVRFLVIAVIEEEAAGSVNLAEVVGAF